MNRKELIKPLDKYEIEYEITNNTKEVEEGLRLFDEALEKIGIIIPKETQVDTITRENDPEVMKYTTEWTSSSDLISRQAAIEALTGWETEPLDEDIVRTLESLPPVTPPFETFCGVPIVEAIEVLEKYKHSPSVTPTERTGITAEMFRNGCLEGIEALMAEGEIYDIDYTGWIPVSERLPEGRTDVLVYSDVGHIIGYYDDVIGLWYGLRPFIDNIEVIAYAWQPLPEIYRPEGENK